MKLIITEAHYKLLLENLIDEVAPSKHSDIRLLNRLVESNTLEVGYSKGGGNYITVGTIDANEIIKKNYNEIISELEEYNMPINQSYGIMIDNLSINLKKSIDKINFTEESLTKIFKEYPEIREEIKYEQKIKRRSLNSSEINDLIKNNVDDFNSVINEEVLSNNMLLVLDRENTSYGNQIFLIIRSNEIPTIFFGISYIIKNNPNKFLKVDNYYNSFENFIENNTVYKTGKITTNTIFSKDIIFNDKLKDKIENNKKTGQGSVFLKDLANIISITKKNIINYLNTNSIKDGEIVTLKVKVDKIGYNLVAHKEENEMTIVFKKGRREGTYFIIDVFVGNNS